MLADPLVVKSLSLTAHTAITVTETLSFPRIDAGDGSAKYVLSPATIGGLVFSRAQIRIAHSVSNENKPALTDRALIRLDVTGSDAEGRAMTGFIYTVIGMPRGFYEPGASLNPVSGYTHLLVPHLGLLAVNVAAATLDETKINRIIAGES
jgi:hypothetical protein